jgi:hypothetical protein
MKDNRLSEMAILSSLPDQVNEARLSGAIWHVKK